MKINLTTPELIARRLLAKRLSKDNEKLIDALSYVSAKTHIEIPYVEAQGIESRVKTIDPERIDFYG